MSPFPFLNTPNFWWIALGAAILFAVAVIIVLIRRRSDNAKRLAIEWNRVEDLLAERSVCDAERARFLSMVRRHHPHDPLSVATKRHFFDLSVDGEMAWLRDHESTEETLRAGAELRDVRVALALDYIPFGQKIESTRELHVGQEIWLALAGDTTPRWSRAQISLVDEARFVATGMHEGPDAPREFREAATLRCRLWREDDARYLFTLTVHRAEKSPLRWTFFHTRSLQRIQDRAHYRVRIDHAADIDVLNASLDENYEGVASLPAVTTFRGRVTSLSAGGIAIVSHQALPKQVLLRFPLVLPEAGRMTLTVKPVDVVPQSAGRFLVRASFVGLDEESRDGIARYVLHRQQRAVAAISGDKVSLQ